MLSEVAIRALPRRAVLRWVMRLLCALVAIGAGVAVEAAAGARDDGVIGAPLCGPDRGRYRKGRRDCDAVHEMLHAFILCGSSGTIRCKGLAQSENDPCRFRARRQRCWLFRFREYATYGITYPTSPAPKEYDLR